MADTRELPAWAKEASLALQGPGWEDIATLMVRYLRDPANCTGGVRWSDAALCALFLDLGSPRLTTRARVAAFRRRQGIR
jgi:hypothetical protein